MKRFIILAFLIAAPMGSLACTCMPSTRDAILERADAVAVVRVENIELLDSQQRKHAAASKIFALKQANFYVYEITKGSIPKSFQAFASDWSLFCGPPLEQGMTKEIAFKKIEEQWVTLECQRDLHTTP